MKRICLLLLIIPVLAGCDSKVDNFRGALYKLPSGIPQSSIRPEGYVAAVPPKTVSSIYLRRHIDATGLHLIEQFEGYSRCAYQDVTGVWTAGFGQTHGVYPGFCFANLAAAQNNLKRSVESEYEWAIVDLHVPLNQHQWDALCSFVYNLGAGIFEGTGVGYDLSHRLWRQATERMREYDHAGGEVLPGLLNRRNEEIALFSEPEKGPSRIELKTQLRKDIAYRAVLRKDLTRGRCRVTRARHKRLGPKCTIWFAQGNQINVKIRQLERAIK